MLQLVIGSITLFLGLMVVGTGVNRKTHVITHANHWVKKHVIDIHGPVYRKFHKRRSYETGPRFHGPKD